MRAFLILVMVVAGLSERATASAPPVGFTILHVKDVAQPQVAVGVWYPSAGVAVDTAVGLFTQRVVRDGPVVGQGRALVAMAHGQGGDFAGQSDLAYALAQAGFVVAAPTFNGDNWSDSSRALDVVGRVRQFEAAVDGVLAWAPAGAVDGRRIGVFGFSSGGTTALILAGGVPDASLVAPHCRAHPEFFDCRLIARFRDPTAPASISGHLVHDGRVGALVLAAPALGFAFTRSGLAGVRTKVQLWEAGRDTILPAPYYAEPVRDGLPNQPEFHVVDGADHMDFLAPCSAKLASVAPQICGERAGFDRAGLHRVFDADVVGFFRQTLSFDTRPNR